MTDFQLSPGITPELTDAVLLLFAVSVGVAYAWRGGWGLELAVGANALLLGVIKLITDYSDPLDVPVALAGIVGGLLVLLAVLRPGSPFGSHRGSEILIGVLLFLIGAYKILRDFYDPFDLLLAALIAVIGVWLITGRYGNRRLSPGPTGNSPPPTGMA